MNTKQQCVDILQKIFNSTTRPTNDALQHTEQFENLLKIPLLELQNLQTLQSIIYPVDVNSTPNQKCSAYVFHTLLTFQGLCGSDIKAENYLDTDEGQTIFAAYKFGIKYAIRPYILKEFVGGISNVGGNAEDYRRLYSAIMFYFDFLPWNILCEQTEGKSLLLNLLYCVFTLKYWRKFASGWTNEDLQFVQANHLNFERKFSEMIDVIPLKEWFKMAMFMNTMPKLPKNMHTIITAALTELLRRPQGLLSFTELITSSFSEKVDSEVPVWKAGDIVIKLVGAKGYALGFYSEILNQIFEYFDGLSNNENCNFDFIPIYASIMNQYLAFNISEIRKRINNYLFHSLDQLSNPPDLLTGIVLLESQEFCTTVFLLHCTFCTASTLALKSSLLVPYQNLLFSLYSKLPPNTKEKSALSAVIVQCLSNRSANELHLILQNVLFNRPYDGMKTLHSRVDINYIGQKYVIKIIPPIPVDHVAIFPHEEFVALLKQSNYNIFVYNVFITILRFLEDTTTGDQACSSTINSPELADADQISNLIFKNFNVQITLLSTLSELINVKSFHSQFYENPNEILEFIKNLITKQLDAPEEMVDVVMLIVLSVFEIFSTKLKHSTLVADIVQLLNKLKRCEINEQVRTKISIILMQFADENRADKTSNETMSKFNLALNMCKEKEPYLQVNGIDNIIKLIKSKDAAAIANKHVILAVALQILKSDKDSYTYLYCIKLLSTLSNIFESEVLDATIAEFQNEHNELDFRLKMGEIIVKITESLGQMAIQYKNILIDCFLSSARNKIDELRTSSLSNLGTICRLLSYQVHNFFQELMQLVESILTSDSYLPARRAAVMTVSQLLIGIDNLLDFQDYLLPIYRALKYILSVETDEITILQAEIGLEALNRKTRDILFPEQRLEKEIKILGIKGDGDDANNISIDGKNSKPKIIELN